MRTIGSIVCLLAALGQSLVGHASDSAARATLIGESLLAKNAHEIIRTTRSLPLEERFDALAEWVFTGPEAGSIRLGGAFLPSDDDCAPLRSSDLQLIAPALDLIDVASVTGRLDELLTRARSITVRDDRDEYVRRAMLFLIHQERGDAEASVQLLDQLYEMFRASEHRHVEDRWPETLTITRATPNSSTRPLAGEWLYLMYEMYINDVRAWRTAGTPAWDRHLLALLGRHHLATIGAQHQSPSQPGEAGSLQNWRPAARQTAASVGLGSPAALWHATGEEVLHRAGHDEDYLYYQVPLAGNFEVECEVFALPWKEAELLVAGYVVTATPNGRGVEIGNLRNLRAEPKLDPPRTRLGEWTGYRVVVRDGLAQYTYHGRKLHEEPLPQDFDPWLAIHSRVRRHGAVRNLRITGEPQVPNEITLSESPDLPGWYPWFEQSVGSEGAWSYEPAPDAADASSQGTIVGTHHPELAGTFHESLLRYHRPMFEDGRIRYEFFYEPGVAHVSPTLGRRAFLLEEEGVHEHVVTAGCYERSGLSPEQWIHIPELQRGSRPLPLQPGSWNAVTLALAGDLLTIELNGEPIYECKVDATDRRFGLFHFADQTEARVRDVRWQGDWPRTLPNVHEQELASPDHECLAGLEDLPEYLTLDFTKPLDESLLEFEGKFDSPPTADGLLFAPVVRQGWAASRIRLREPLYGDFDAKLRFTDLKVVYGSKGTMTLELNLNEGKRLVIGSTRSQGAPDRSDLVAKRAEKLPDGSTHYSGARVRDELMDGTLRLVRRGDQVHALVAYGDSEHYRYVGSNTLPTAEMPVHLHLQANSSWGGSLTAMLQSLTIRSNSRFVEEQLDPRVVAIDQYVASFKHRQGARIFRGGGQRFTIHTTPEAAPLAEGLVVDTTANETTVTVEPSFTGDFELAARIDASQLPIRPAGDSGADLKVTVPGDHPVTARLQVARLSQNIFEVSATATSKEGKGETVVVEPAELADIQQLRIVRIQQTLLFIVYEEGVGRLLGHVECTNEAIPARGAELTVSGASNQTSPIWRSFSVAASGQDS